MKPHVLIATAYWPFKTGSFEQYSKGISELIKTDKASTQFFITTSLKSSKYESNVTALQQAERWAKEYRFNYILIVDADLVITKDDFEKMLSLEKDVLLVGRGKGRGLVSFCLEDEVCGKHGWGCALIKVDVLKKFPFVYVGDFLSPDRMWFKMILREGIKIWCDLDIIPKILEPSVAQPMPAFVGETKGK